MNCWSRLGTTRWRKTTCCRGWSRSRDRPGFCCFPRKRKGSAFSRVLQVQGYAVVESAPEANPLTLPELSSFDLVVLDNVPAFQLS